MPSPRKANHPASRAYARRRFDRLYSRLYPDAVHVERDSRRESHESGINAIVFFPDGTTRSFMEILTRNARPATVRLEVWYDAKRQRKGWVLDVAKKAEYVAYAVQDHDACTLFKLRPLRDVLTFSDTLQRWIDSDPKYPRKAHVLDMDGHMRESWSVVVDLYRLSTFVTTLTESF